jgi:hypothetical protein
MTTHPLRGSCECGACWFEVHKSPKARFRCHCLICQAFNSKPFADVVAVRAKDVVLKTPAISHLRNTVRRRTSTAGSAGLAAGPSWRLPALGPFKVMFIPASNFEPEARLPPVRMDIFYHRRVLDMPDSLPKYSGYLPSELAIGKMIMSGLWNGESIHWLSLNRLLP